MLAMESRDAPARPTVLAKAPEELTTGRLRRLGEGVGKVVYASDHWVVNRARSTSEIVALIIIWKLARKLARFLPGGGRAFEKPSRRMRLLRVVLQALIALAPRGVWYTTHIGEMWRLHQERNRTGERLAQAHLSGTSLLPEQITFPPVRVYVGGWAGWLFVSQATQRVEATLDARLRELAARGRFDELEQWLLRFIEFRQAGWQRGVFSVDAHLKNFGVCADRVVLLDTGGLTNRWSEIETRLVSGRSDTPPHMELGMGSLLENRPDIAERFNHRWREAVSRSGVQKHWPV